MTGPQWSEAFKKGDPEAVARVLYEAYRHATQLVFSDDSDPVWDDRDQAIHEQWVQFGQILQDQGALRVTEEPR